MLMDRSNRYRPGILPGLTWNELFFTQTGALENPFYFQWLDKIIAKAR